MSDSANALPDLSSLPVSQLRELIADPDRYTPEAVHAAARELAARAAVPRYYGRLKARGMDAPVIAVRRTRLDPDTWTRILFADSRLKVLCGLIAFVQLLQLANWIRFILDDLHRFQARQVPLNWTFYVDHGLPTLLALLLFLFFATLYRTLLTRGVPQG